MASFFISLIIILGIQVLLEFVLYRVLGLSYIWVEVIINIVLSFLFSFINYQGDKKECFKDPTFHKNVAIYFVILMIVTVIFIFI